MMGSVRGTVEFLGYLCEEDNSSPRRVWQQKLVVVDYECECGGGGEQSGLRCELYSSCWSVSHS